MKECKKSPSGQQGKEGKGEGSVGIKRCVKRKKGRVINDVTRLCLRGVPAPLHATAKRYHHEGERKRSNMTTRK